MWEMRAAEEQVRQVARAAHVTPVGLGLLHKAPAGNMCLFSQPRLLALLCARAGQETHLKQGRLLHLALLQRRE